MMKTGKTAIFLAIALFICSSVSAQQIQLRHQFLPGEMGKAMTNVQMQGDSFITGEKAATQLQMQMLRGMQVGAVDSMGNAKVDVAVQRIRTQGKMENSSFNKDLTGAELKSVMYGADNMSVEISPLGYVRGQDNLGLQKLGITLPSSLGDSGGFEFPTFPVEPVRVGSVWNENGQLLKGASASRNNLSSDGVYKLYRVYNSPQGRIGVIRYQKVSDLSGLGLGGSALGGQSAVGGAPGANASGLVIQLEGEIEFNIDKGEVVKTTQQGYWNLDMNINMGMMDLASMGGANPNALSPKSPKSNGGRTGLKQSMKIKISTQFQWTGGQKPQEPKEIEKIVPQIKPPTVINPPSIQDLPDAVPPKEVP